MHVHISSKLCDVHTRPNIHSYWLYRLKFEDDLDTDVEAKPAEPAFYDNDPQLPVFSTLSSGYQAIEVARILVDPRIDLAKVCQVQPKGVTKNTTFIVDVDRINFDDFKADDLGSWVTKGTKAYLF